jgi:hypothetical protein
MYTQDDGIDIKLERKLSNIPVDKEELPSSAGLLSETGNENRFENPAFVRDYHIDISYNANDV